MTSFGLNMMYKGQPSWYDFIWVPFYAMLFFSASIITKRLLSRFWRTHAAKAKRADLKEEHKFCELGFKFTNHIILGLIVNSYRHYLWYISTEYAESILFERNRPYDGEARLFVFFHQCRYIFLNIDIVLDLLFRGKSFGRDWIEMWFHHFFALVALQYCYFNYTLETVLRVEFGVALSDASLGIGRMLMMLEFGFLAKIFSFIILVAWGYRLYVFLLVMFSFQKTLFFTKPEHITPLLAIFVLFSYVFGVYLQTMWFYKLLMGGLRILMGKKLKKGQDRDLT